MNKIPYILAVSIFILGCAMPTFLATATPQPTNSDCSSMTITDADIDMALKYKASVFSKGDWKRSYTVSDESVVVNYFSERLKASAIVDIFILCNASKDTLQVYANDTTISNWLKYYEKNTFIASCEQNDTLLTQYTAKYEQVDYNLNLWLKPLDDGNHGLWISFLLPQADSENMAAYGAEFYPDFISCQ